LALECAGHGALTEHGPALLAAGIDLIAVSSGAMADPEVSRRLLAAQDGGGRLSFASGAIGALDALAAAREGGLEEVTYRGSKPPAGWRGSPAEAVLDLDRLAAPAVHFTGTAREAARRYPQNANVAASVAMAGLGFDATRVELVADPALARNVHALTFRGAFGSAGFEIAGESLPGAPKSSALTAMSLIAEARRRMPPPPVRADQVSG
ncbi:aspartate dehydrogenase, partial [Oceaniglobus roseus]|uniref:aspartate dehydrogenase n=1 Tax=Oceaniglobus roseus TaxID=1737570 RepID=UPI000C7F4F81